MDVAVKAAWIAAVATVLAALIGLAGVLITRSDEPGSRAATLTGPTTVTTSNASPARCMAMIREVRQLPVDDPELAAELAREGQARVPSLWGTDEIAQCGGVAPETLLEGSLVP
jgi:hypothetical protein